MNEFEENWDEEPPPPPPSSTNMYYNEPPPAPSTHYERTTRRYMGGEALPPPPTTTIYIPSHTVGRVIGKAGLRIKNLQHESNTRIIITKEKMDDQTKVLIYGNQQSVDKAINLINQHTENRSSPTSTPTTSGLPTQTNTEKTFKRINWQECLAVSDEYEKEKWSKLPEIKKNFYHEHPEITKLDDMEIKKFRLINNNIVVNRTFKEDTNKLIPKPIETFKQAFYQYPEILNEIKKNGFEKPSPIQSQAWPILLSGEDMIGIAQTGTGKTLAFLLPALIHIVGQHVKRQQRNGQPAVLIMAPTRELALQIDKEIKKYQYHGITALCVYGGGNRYEQIRTLTDGVDIIIATPGRLNDLIANEHLDVRFVTYVVLDEADRMLDMGFEPQIRKIMYSIRPNRQTVMTSATWPDGVRRLAGSYMQHPIQVYVGTLDLAATHSVKQIIDLLPDDDQSKYEHFINFLKNLNDDDKIIVFCGKKARADQLSSELCLAGYYCQSLHGDRDQADREQALKDIADGVVQILIATDVASRGLDIDDITHVINYDFPRNIEEYVHRVGRTGRAGKSGTSISYFTRSDWSHARELIEILEEAEQFVPDEIRQMAERYEAWKQRKATSSGGGGGFRNRRW